MSFKLDSLPFSTICHYTRSQKWTPLSTVSSRPGALVQRSLSPSRSPRPLRRARKAVRTQDPPPPPPAPPIQSLASSLALAAHTLTSRPSGPPSLAVYCALVYAIHVHVIRVSAEDGGVTQIRARANPHRHWHRRHWHRRHWHRRHWHQRHWPRRHDKPV